MSDESSDAKPYQVGFGKPPVSTRFQKGSSGNPRGRPKRKKEAPISTAFGSQAAESMLLAEAYRSVSLREGDKLIELPALQAVYRSMSVSALKGSRLAATAFAAMVRNVETEHHRLKFEHFNQAIAYKQDWEEQFQACDAAGTARPAPLPHPDDIHINPNTGDVRILGPKCPEEKRKWDGALAQRDQAQLDFAKNLSLSTKARDPDRKTFYKIEALIEQRIFDIINDRLPDRYRRELEGRFWRKEDLEILPPYKPARQSQP